jgi:ABC-2 type transport system ATP-binding protein
MIEVHAISKSFGPVHAVSHVSFTITDGEIVGFLGPNGAGKSTTMRMMTGYIAPDEGDITIDGVSVLASPILIQEKIGYLPENNPLYKDMIVADFLQYSARLKGIAKQKIADAISQSIEYSGIAEVYYRPISQLSKGYKQRVGLACALLHMPKILILDEPQEGLDPNQRAEIRDLIRTLAKKHTILLSTHVLGEVEAVCGRMIILNKGVVVADGTTNELMKKGGGSNQLLVEIEGKNVEKELRHEFGTSLVHVDKAHEGRYTATFAVKRTKLQPELSRVAKKNDWIIWKLTEEAAHLEQVFQKLTEG